MMTKERLYLYDTTLRDGQQMQGVQFTAADKITITQALDQLGIDYIEGGWPGANPTDSEFFATRPQTKAVNVAFGMTKRAGRSAENDDVLAGVLNAQTPAVCLVGKASSFHVTDALGIELDENVQNIKASFEHVSNLKREGLFDAEHFFDGYKLNPTYALETLHAAYSAGCRWIVLCDTNGGTLPDEITMIVKDVIASGIPGDHLGIHTHNDTEQAIAGAFAAVRAGVRQVQGTLNGLGERCGNANLIALIPTLLFKEPFASQFELGITPEGAQSLLKLSRMIDDLLNRVPSAQAAYVGSSAFVHKSGLHASAILKNPKTYEHVDPDLVGNQRFIPMSNQAGQSNLRKRLDEAGVEIGDKSACLPRILERIKEKEALGYSYDTAQASFEMLARAELGQAPDFFKVERYRVTAERRTNAEGKMVSFSEAVVVANVQGQKVLNVSDSFSADGEDQGPVHALANALVKDLGPYSATVQDIRLIDFKVRIINSGTNAITRVIIDSEDADGRIWSSVGVSANIIDASFDALVDSLNWRLLRDLGAA